MSHQVVQSHTPTSQIIHRHSVHQLILLVLCNIFMQNVNASATVTRNLFISSAPKRIQLHGKKLSFCLLMLRWICEKFARQPKRQSICFTPLHCRRSSFERWPLINIQQMELRCVRTSTKSINTLFTHYHVCNNIKHPKLCLIFVGVNAI